MKKLYDEIMALDNPCDDGVYGSGFEDAKEKSAKLAKKYDDEIADLKKRLATANEYLESFYGDD
jgi:hypothetical protein